MKILFAADLHGKPRLYEELFVIASRSGARCILLGGDLLPTKIDGPINLVMGKTDFSVSLRAQIDFIDTWLAPKLNAFMDDNPAVEIFYIPGNHEWVHALKHLEKKIPRAKNIHLSPVSISGFQLMGYGCVTDSSFWVKDHVRRDFPGDGYFKSLYACISGPEGISPSEDGAYIGRYPSIDEELSALVMDDPGRTICLFHAPPYDTGLDTLHNGRPIGSRAIRRFIEKRQPLVSLHGHIHEAPCMSGHFSSKLGRTLAVNPGHSAHVLHAVIFDADNPEGTMEHCLFGDRSPRDQANLLDRCILKGTAFVMNNILAR